MRNSEAGAGQSTRPSFGRHRKSGRAHRKAIAAGRKPSEAPGKTKNREIGKSRRAGNGQLNAPKPYCTI